MSAVELRELRITPPELVARADYAMFTIYYAIRKTQGYRSRIGASKRMREKRMFITLRLAPGLEPLFKENLDRFREEEEAAKRLGMDLVHEAAESLKYVEYLLDTPMLPLAILPVISIPPDLTWGKVPPIEPTTWYGSTFFTLKKSKAVHKKFFSRLMLGMGRIMFNRWLSNIPTLSIFYRKNVSKYLGRGLKEGHAKALARRDVVRVWLGNAWLIATLQAIDEGKLTPEEVRLPYPLEKDPMHVFIDPADTVVEDKSGKWRSYTWSRLRRIVES